MFLPQRYKISVYREPVLPIFFQFMTIMSQSREVVTNYDVSGKDNYPVVIMSLGHYVIKDSELSFSP